MLDIANQIIEMLIGSHPDDRLWWLVGFLIITAFICSIPLVLFGDKINDYLEGRKDRNKQ